MANFYADVQYTLMAVGACLIICMWLAFLCSIKVLCMLDQQEYILLSSARYGISIVHEVQNYHTLNYAVKIFVKIKFLKHWQDNARTCLPNFLLYSKLSIANHYKSYTIQYRVDKVYIHHMTYRYVCM